MCGLLGFVDYSKELDKDLFDNMLSCLRHRGPDDQGIESFDYNNFSVFMGHKRLAILDLSSHGHQPMSYKDLVIIYNGEVYNFKEIQEELIEKGYIFDSDSDTEVILKSYHCWGVEAVHKFRGMFAFAIFDKARQEIIILRDRVGVKPLYYYFDDTSFIFSSEIKPVLRYPQFDRTLDYEAIASYLYFGYIHGPRSIFKAIKKLQPGHYLKFDISTKQIQINSYWQIEDYYETKKHSKQNIVDELESVLTESFNLRKVSNVPIGTFLSGGIDSSLVTAILQKNSDIPINTFSIGFEDKAYDESKYAKEIANYLGTNHTERICTKEETLEIIKTLPHFYDEPFADSSAIPTILASKLAKEKVTVVLSGDGGDELFCGYTSYSLMEKRFNAISRLPFKHIFKKVFDIVPLPLITLNKFNENLYTKFMRFKSVLILDDVASAFKASSSVFSNDELYKLIKRTVKIENEGYVNTSDLEKMMITDFRGYLPDDLLVKVDRATMSVSLEGREPLLDHKIIEFAAKIPIHQKRDKKILKEILARYIPESLFLRKKQGFGIPINNWLRNDLRYLLEQYISQDAIERSGVFNYEYVDKLLKLFLAGKNDDRKIWTILMFQMWYSENLDN